MYPQRELIRLAAYKAKLRDKIALRRVECAAAAAHATRPLVWVDRAMDLWRKYGTLVPLVAVPLAFLGARSLLPKLKTLGMLLRWRPLIFGAVRGFKSLVSERR